MDFSEKDAARSKYRSSRKNQRHRGRGRGRHPQSSKDDVDLGTNIDRFIDDEESSQQTQPSSIPPYHSQGADLADWLDQYPAQDPLYYAHQKMLLVQDVGLPPPDAAAFQGLSVDVEKLAECLGKIPIENIISLSRYGGDGSSHSINNISDDDTWLHDDMKNIEERLLHGLKIQETESVNDDRKLDTTRIEEEIKVPSSLSSIRQHTAGDDDELDELLALDSSLGVGDGGGEEIKNEKEKGDTSLEDWLDSL